MSRYTPTAGQDRENLRRFTYHAPNPDQPERYDPICEVALGLATVICENCPQSRELSIALAKLEEAVMWASAAISRNE